MPAPPAGVSHSTLVIPGVKGHDRAARRPTAPRAATFHIDYGLSGGGKNTNVLSPRSSAATPATIPNATPAKTNDGNGIYGSVTTSGSTCGGTRGGTREGRSAATVFEFANNPAAHRRPSFSTNVTMELVPSLA